MYLSNTYSTNPNFLATNRINELKNNIESKYHNKPNGIYKKIKFLSKEKLKKLKNKPGLKIETNFLNDNHFIREFEDLFEKTTNNNINEYFYGRKVEKMDDLVKRIKEFNYSDFIKKLKKKKK